MPKAMAAWRALAHAYWRCSASTGDERALKIGKVHRLKAKHWLWATSHQLKSICGCSLLRWQLPASHSERSPARGCAVVTLCIDQGSDGWAASHWLMGVQTVAMILIADSNHRVWNDLELAIRDTGLWQLTLMCVVLCNIAEGAWRDVRWWQQAKEAVDFHAALSGSTCPLLAGFASAILSENGDGHLVGAPGMDDRLRELFAQAVQHKMPKVSMCRWFAFVDAMEALLPQWSARLAIYTFVALQFGRLGEVKTTKFAQAQLSKLKPGEDVQRATTAQDKEDVRRLRLSCASTMVYAIKLLSDGDLRRLSQGLVLMVAPLRAWYGQQSCSIRSGEESLRFFAGMAQAEALKPMQATLDCLQDIEFWSAVGISVVVAASAGLSPPVDPESPLVLGENDLSSVLGELPMNLVSRRMASVS